MGQAVQRTWYTKVSGEVCSVNTCKAYLCGVQCECQDAWLCGLVQWEAALEGEGGETLWRGSALWNSTLAAA
jgi:hypothetical protein